MRLRRTIKRYVELFRNPRTLFPGGPDDTGADVILFPNGQREIWIRGSGNKGYRIRASEGPMGLGLQIDTFIGSEPMTLIPDDSGDTRHVSICQYHATPKAQAFKKAYLSGEPGALDAFHKEWEGGVAAR